MSENNNQTSVTRENDVSDFPVAAIVCLSVGGYVILVMIFLIIRRLLVSKGMLQFSCCCPDSTPACCVCVKFEEVWPSCCCSCCCREGCLATMCWIDKETKCKDIFCCCCTCQQGCCDSCPGVCSTCLYCCHHPPKCCACDNYCPSCFGSDLDPNSCGCLCLEIKFRTAHRSSSAPPRGNQNQNIDVEVSPDDLSNHGNMYYTGKLKGITADRSLERSKIGDDSIREKQQSPSHSPTKAATHFHQTLPEKLNAFNSTDIPEGHNPVYVNFSAALDEPLARHELQQHLSSTVLSSSAPGGLLTRLTMNAAISSEMEPSHRPTSRSRRLIRPGQISQRFPNKILVSSESLNFCCLEKTKNVMSEVYLIPNNEESLSNVAIQYDAGNLHRPLPTLKRTI